jgi:hypothetical protein
MNCIPAGLLLIPLPGQFVSLPLLNVNNLNALTKGTAVPSSECIFDEFYIGGSANIT